ELAGGLLDLFREFALRIAGPAARRLLPGRRAATLALGFLFLPARQLLQLLGQLVDLLVRLLLGRLLAHLVLIRHPVHFQLEQLGEIAVLLLPAATAAASLLLPDLDLRLVLLFRLLQILECLLLRVQCLVGSAGLALAFGRLQSARALRRELDDPREGPAA